MRISHEEAISRCWAEVSLSTVAQNYKNALTHIRADTQIIGVLKADAYGLGAPEVAKRLWQEGMKTFAAASYNEAQQIQSAVPGCDVLILGLAGESQLVKAIDRGMLLTVFSKKYAETVVCAAKKAGKAARVHFKIETGLNRLGLEPGTAADIIADFLASGWLKLEGLFTHLALRDRESDRLQLDRLLSVRDALRERNISVPMLHALDSIGMVRYENAADQMDAVRCGAWLYGVYPRRDATPEDSHLAITVKTRVALLHRVRAGECLGYDETHPVSRDSLIATLSAGYMDGFPRLNSVGEVEIRGKRAPVVGLVCMDQMMVDATDIPGVQEGDEVILLGSSIGVDEYAAWGNLNRNEALARTGRRVPRVYMENGEVLYCIDALESKE